MSYVLLITGGREKSHDVIGCCRTKPECLLEVGMGDSQRTRSTQNVHVIKMANFDCCAVMIVVQR